jgi:hypothetical protein
MEPLSKGQENSWRPPSWCFYSGSLNTDSLRDYPGTSGEWHWKNAPPMGDAPFFNYSTKRGYRNIKKPSHTPGIHTFVHKLNLQNSSISQMITKIWRNSRPRKVGTLIWLTFNCELPIGTWLQCMGISPSCKVCRTRVPKTRQHCLLENPVAKRAWEAFKSIWLK